MAPKHRTRDALLLFLRADTEPRPLLKIYRHMGVFHGTKPGAVRMALQRLVRAGLVERVELGYQMVPCQR